MPVSISGDGEFTGLTNVRTEALSHPDSADNNISLFDNGSTALAVGYRYVGTRYFFSDGDFEKADPLLTGDIGLRAIRVRCVGGGGAGGGANTTGAGLVSPGGGGGGGGYAERFFTNIAALDTSVTVTRGLGGVGAVGATGGNGGESEFGGSGDAWRTRASGGFGGPTEPNQLINLPASGGAGGSGLNGDLLGAGGFGTTCMAFTVQAFRAIPGDGGTSIFGGGGQGRVFAGGGVGEAGRGFGGGGGGSYNEENQGTARAGGAGANGVVIVDCYV